VPIGWSWMIGGIRTTVKTTAVLVMLPNEFVIMTV